MRIISLFIILSVVSGVSLYSPAHAQSDATKKALEDVKDSVSTLIIVKDEENQNGIAFRIEAFKKVIDFSIAEAKDLKIKLLALDVKKLSTSTNIWGSEAMKKLDSALEYYDTEKSFMKEHEGEITLEEIKDRAESFKMWREKTYLPAANQINEYFLVEQQKQALETTENRTEKVRADIEKLKKARIKTWELQKMISKVDILVKNAQELNDRAATLFYETRVLPLLPDEHIKITNEETERATSSATSTATGEAEKKPPSSIEDLAKESFARVKDVYRIFIDMSNLVNKLL